MFIRHSLFACWLGVFALGCGSNPEVVIRPVNVDGDGGAGGQASVDPGPGIDLEMGGNVGPFYLGEVCSSSRKVRSTLRESRARGPGPSFLESIRGCLRSSPPATDRDERRR